MPENKKVMGMSKPVFIAVLLGILALTIVSFLAGGIGQALFGIEFPEWLVVHQPEPHLPPSAIFHIGGLAVTNTMFTAWISIALLTGLFWAATRRMKLVPGRFQAAAESVIGYLYDFCTDIAGEKNGRKFFPLVATIFLFVITNALMNLIPGYNSILIGEAGHQTHLLRGANTDVNFPLALAVISFVMVEYWGLKSVGVFHYLGKFFNFGPFIHSIRHFRKEGVMGVFNGLIAIFIGLIELMAEFIRIISFTFRLFGNMTGGEILLVSMLFLMPFLLALPFYGLELLVGFIQALIFAGLTLVFAHIAVTPHTGEASEHH
ncbi:F0F1 ATP synthase subunit A [Dehalogenimonas sp. THU2]|uniref:F0F1 ATP synthase subunit A n=1 Tax=Dehalogenimonas sp. THU2 TaxID=3151121 RepID=UPI003218A3D6